MAEMLTYTGTRPFYLRHDDDPVKLGDTVPATDYLKSRGDFVAAASPQPSAAPLSPPAAPTTTKQPKKTSGR